MLAPPLCALAEENATDISKIKAVGSRAWDEKTLLETAEARIQQHRTGLAEIRVLDRDGLPLKNTRVRGDGVMRRLPGFEALGFESNPA